MNKPNLSRRVAIVTRACVVAILLMSSSTATRADDPNFLGPIETTNQRPYQLLFLAFPPQSADVLRKGRRGTAVKFDFGFDYLDPSPAFGAVVKEETETDRVEYDESIGLGKNWQASIAVPIVWRNGGFLGTIVGPYHDLIHFNDPTVDAWQGRGHAALFHSLIYDQRSDGTVAIDAGPAFGLGDTSLFLKKAVWNSRNGHTNVAARAGLKLPTGNASQLLGSGGVDGGYDVDLSQEITRKLAVHANYSRIWMQRPTKLDNDANTVTAYSVALELHLHHSASWIIQTEGTETTFRTGNTFADGAPRIAGIGYKWMPKPNTLWSIAFTEGGDYQTFHWPGVSNIGPDFVITIDMVRTR